ncbi:MAG: RpiB/LacA/LacB family sugar-phosphate isomerase [Proteiniphilum sp.]|jgi:ribose 5-phosphate isomerase B|nr:RpiB/LacA/LacB family sugar-phosphate isomerase [Proteiniphilum sp.]
MSLFDHTEKPIGLASDHAGYRVKQFVARVLEERGIPLRDFGTYSEESCDYPDFAHPLAHAVEEGVCYPGVASCGTGTGISIALNKHQGVRAALCWTPEVAFLARAHNDANVLVLPGRLLGEEKIYEILVMFLNTPFEGGRHGRRVSKIPCR